MPVPANAQAIWAALTAAGADNNTAAGIMGNIEQESGGDPELLDPSVGIGLVQWLPPNYSVDRAGNSPLGPLVTGDVTADINRQVAYIVATGGLAQAAGLSPEASASAFMTLYERCAPGACNEPRRRQSAGDVAAAAASGQWPAGTASATSNGSSGAVATVTAADAAQPGTGLTGWDVLLSAGGLGELMTRLAETVAGGVLVAVGLIMILLTVAGRSIGAGSGHVQQAAKWGRRLSTLVAAAL
jgi:Phage tail lysozyme